MSDHLLPLLYIFPGWLVVDRSALLPNNVFHPLHSVANLISGLWEPCSRPGHNRCVCAVLATQSLEACLFCTLAAPILPTIISLLPWKPSVFLAVAASSERRLF